MKRHNWPALLAEFKLGHWKSPTAYAKGISMNPSQVRKAFKRLDSLGKRGKEELARQREGAISKL